MGTDDLQLYMKRYKLAMPKPIAKIMKSYPKMDLQEFVNKGNQQCVTAEALDLLEKMLVYDKNLRITPIDAMAHIYFDPIRKLVLS